MKKNKIHVPGKLTKEDLNKLTEEGLEWLDNEHIKALEDIKKFTEKLKEKHKENAKIGDKLKLSDKLKQALKEINSLPFCLVMDEYYNIFRESCCSQRTDEISAVIDFHEETAAVLNEVGVIEKHVYYLEWSSKLYSLFFFLKRV